MNVRVSARWGAKRSRGIAMSLALIAALMWLGGSPAALLAQEGNPNPGVLPRQADAFDTTYEELALQWWLWLIETPYDVNPVVDQTGEHAAEGQSGKVWFLAGNFGGETVRTVTVPAGKALFFPISTYGAWKPTDGNTEEELLATAKFYTDATTELACIVDGVALQDLYSYRVVSPFGTFGPNDMTDQPLGSDLLVADGYWLLLAPLSAGKHVIEFSAVLGPAEEPWFSLHVKYNLTVGRECR